MEPLARYAAWNAHGEVSLEATIKKFRSHLEYAIYLFRRDGCVDVNELEEQMLDIDWTNKVEAWVNEAGGYSALNSKGKIDSVVKHFSTYLSENIQKWKEEEEESKRAEESRRANIFKAYEELETEIAPEPIIVQTVLMISKTKPKRIKEESENIKDEIGRMIVEQHLGRIQGPQGGLALAKKANGQMTEASKVKGLTYGAIVRERKPK